MSRPWTTSRSSWPKAQQPLRPILTWSNEQIASHVDAMLSIPGAQLLFGGQPLTGHSIPAIYGAYQATAVQVPLAALAGDQFGLVTTELFGPFQVIVTYGDDDLPMVLDALNRLSHHLTAAVVSSDIEFQNRVLGATVNGTTYCGMRARTTGAPQTRFLVYTPTPTAGRSETRSDKSNLDGSLLTPQ